MARMSPESNEIIRELVVKTGKSRDIIIQEALECYKIKEIMRLYNESYDKLKSDPKAWKDELNDRADLEGTLGDGLEGK